MVVSLPSDQAARERIHTDLDTTLFVEAGAGTGKTRELIERILALVLSGRTLLRHVAAITFTEAAAAELRDRVRARLEQAARDEALSADERARASAALAEIDLAAIETLHAFAQRILAEHPLEAGLPPAIEVQDEIRSSIAFDDRWADVLDELLAAAALEEPLLRAFSLGLEVAHLRALAWVLHQHWDRVEDATINVPPLPPVDIAPLVAALDEACALRRHCTNPDDLLYRHLEGLDAYRERLRSAESAFDQLRVLSEGTTIKFRRGQKGNWLGFSPSLVRDHLDNAELLRGGLLATQRAGALMPILAALRDFILRYAAERRSQGRLEFHDLLVQARDLLRREASVRRHVRAQFTHLLIDEFQDTDPLQIEIAVLIAGRETDGAPPRWHEAELEDGRLFFVGDPKQSIYRFRRADIALYQRAQRRFLDRTVRLTQNFRSLASVIEWVNAAFEQLMSESDGQAAYVKLEYSWAQPGDPSVRTIGGPVDANLQAVRDVEAREIARVIRAIKAEGWPVVETAPDGARRERAAGYQDVAVLMPTRTPLATIEDALEDAAIPYRVESQSLVYDTQEVRDLLSVLRAIDDPTDQVALIAALRSPAFACADDELWRYHEAGGRWDYRRPAPEGVPPDGAVVSAMTALHDLHRRRWWEPIGGVVEAIIRERRLFELSFAHRRPRSRWQRLRFVLDQARAFGEAGGRTLRQFIDWAERQADEGTRVVETVVPEPDDDAVRIMTIHAAKGLEFPIVVLTGLNITGRRQQETSSTVLWRADGAPEVSVGVGFKTPGFDAIAEREDNLERHEKVRLLYVAATRARDHLIVSLHHKAGSECHAATIYPICQAAPELWRPLDALAALPPPNGPAPPPVFADGPARRAQWLATRREQIERFARAPRRSATEVALAAPGGEDDPNLRKDVPVEEQPPWRRGRAGTALGRAVHAVLQTVDLATGADVESAARAQAAAEGIAGREADVARMARTALASAAVREALAPGARSWRELYVSTPVDGVSVEGFVDLLYEAPDGLVVVDYKTDVVPDERKLDEAMARYRLQGAAYALALETALGRPVVRCVFVFVQPRGAVERAVEDLPGAVTEVRGILRAGA